MIQCRSFVVAGLVSVAVFSPERAKAQPAAQASQHLAENGSVTNNFTKIESPGLNGNPNAIVFVQPVAYQKHVGVFYDQTSSRWAVFNQDKSPMQRGARFNFVSDSAGFVHRTTAANINQNWTWIDSAAGNQLAVILVTQRWNPAGANGGYNDRGVGVWYDFNKNKWAIYNEDKSAMGVGLEFNVRVWNAPTLAATPRVGTWATGPGNPNGATTIPLALGAGVGFLTHQYKNGTGGIYYTAPWSIGPGPTASGGLRQLSEVRGAAAIPNDLTFNVVTY